MKLIVGLGLPGIEYQFTAHNLRFLTIDRTQGCLRAMANTTTRDDLVAALDAEGKPLPDSVSRSDAHRRGIWHSSVSVFVLNRYGEVLIERRSENKDLFPGYYDIPGGHLRPGQAAVEGASQEIYEELGLVIPQSRLEALTQENGVIERVVLPERAIINLERKTIYLLQLTATEEDDVFRLAAGLLRLTSEELAERGTSGEVSQIQFWHWERLLEMSTSTGHRPIASGTLSALSDDMVRGRVSRCSLELREICRRKFSTRYAFLNDGRPIDDTYDQRLFDHFIERPSLAASVEQVNAAFNKGPRQLAGAYELGLFRQAAAGDEHWGQKLRDPETRYVKNLLAALGFNQGAGVQQRLDRFSAEIQSFVSELLNFPLSDGLRFRDCLGNLADIAAARKAVLVWLKHAGPSLPPGVPLEHPTRMVTKACLIAGRDILVGLLTSNTETGQDRFHQLVLLGLGASSADFNNPAFQGLLKERPAGTSQIARFLEQRTAHELNPALGREHFLSEFYTRFVGSGDAVTIAYLAGNAAQGHISLALAQEILRTNRNATVRFIAKSSSPGNDLTFEDAEEIIAASGGELFLDLAHFRDKGRFTLVQDGPQCHGLDPGRLSANVASVLGEAEVILAEGQAYAEIRGWKKPTYIAFRVNGRVAEAIHGISRATGACGFVRLTPGVDHFDDFQSVVHRMIEDAASHRRIPAAGQTTAEYVCAVLGENLDLIVRDVFHGNYLEACQRLNSEARKLGKTFAQVLAGAASEPPEAATVTEVFRDARFPVFACGGGGGFSAVTLRALHKLGLPVVAGVPSTDDGGSTGELQRWLRVERGFVFGAGDMAAILQDAMPDKSKQALLAFRFDDEPESLTSAVMRRIKAEIDSPTYPDSAIGAADDFLSFTCDQLNLARVIDKSFRGADRSSKLPVRGASIRNLNVIAAYELCGVLGDQVTVTDDSRLAAFYVLQKALRLPPSLLVVPVTYQEGVLFAEYGNPITRDLAEAFAIPEEAIANNQQRLYGQQYIDKLSQVGPRTMVGVVKAPGNLQQPRVNPEYLARMRQAELFVMGAGSLVGSQLSQLAVPGVVDVLLERPKMRRILVLNHVKLDETLGMSLRDQVRLIEATATKNASRGLLAKLGVKDKCLRISDLFTDIVVPRTIAQEIETEMLKRKSAESSNGGSRLQYVDFPVPGSNRTIRVFYNRYVKFLIENADFCEEYDVTGREIEVLSHLDQPAALYHRRSEAGRYRGALYATMEDIDYLVAQGIQRRRIHEVDCVGENWKFVKAAGTPSLEFFPGLVPEALVGIFRIALEQAGSPSKPVR